jgi:hypothetical protein
MYERDFQFVHFVGHYSVSSQAQQDYAAKSRRKSVPKARVLVFMPHSFGVEKFSKW